MQTLSLDRPQDQTSATDSDARAAEAHSKKAGIIVITGYLGAGKTTLFNRILTSEHGRRVAVIVNEIGAVGIDHHLLLGSTQPLVEMSNGCLCCTVRGDLVRTMSELFLKRAKGEVSPFKRMVVETTGLADPAPVAQTFLVDEEVKARTKLDAIVTVVDARHLLDHIGGGHEVVEQIAFADIILLNKLDLVDEARRAEVEARIRSLNGFAPIHATRQCDVPLERILDQGSFDLDRILASEPHFLEHHHHDHESEVTSVSFSTERPVVPDRFQAWISGVLREQGADIYRSKGILNVAGSPKRYVFQGVHMQLETEWGLPWRPTDKRDSRIVFIGRKLDGEALKAGFLACAK
jgi:G3E family GTPase